MIEHETEQPEQVELPFVSIIMPIRNEASFIEQSLRAILAQQYPANKIEVLVVDGMSDDGTRTLVQHMIKQAPLPVILLDNTRRIVPTAFNIGLRHAQGEIIIRIDGHCEVAPDYVRRCVEVLKQTGADNVGGLQRAVGTNWVGRAIALATSSPFGVGGARFHYSAQPGWVDTVFLGAYRREVFKRIGGFDEELVRNQDDEFNFRLLQANGRIWLDPSIQSVYYSRASLRKLWRQYFQYGQYKVLVIRKRGAVASWRHLVPGVFILSLVGTLLLALITRKARWTLVVAGPYAVANLGASTWTGQKDWNALPLLPLAFLILHLAYGLGFLSGLWRWRTK